MSGMGMSVKSNIDQVVRQFRGIDKKVVNKAIVTALNKTGDQVKTLAKKEIASATGIKAGRVSKRITVKKATWNNQNYRLRVEGRHFSLSSYTPKPKETKTGVKHSAWGQRQVAKGAFIINGMGGNQVVVKRVRGQTDGKGRPKIKALYGASAPVEYFRADVDEKLKAKVKEKFPKLLATALDFQFRKSMNKGKKIVK